MNTVEILVIFGMVSLFVSLCIGISGIIDDQRILGCKLLTLYTSFLISGIGALVTAVYLQG